MTKFDNKFVPQAPKTYEVKYVEATQLPKLSEITDKNGKVKLPLELISKLRDPQARFNNDLVVFPVGYEDWEDLYVACMSAGCNDTDFSYWRHGNCRYSSPGRIRWSTHANLKCPSCGEISDISKWRFICHGSGCTETTTNLTKLTDVVVMALDYECVNKDFARKFLRNAREIFNR